MKIVSDELLHQITRALQPPLCEDKCMDALLALTAVPYVGETPRKPPKIQLHPQSDLSEGRDMLYFDQFMADQGGKL